MKKSYNKLILQNCFDFLLSSGINAWPVVEGNYITLHLLGVRNKGGLGWVIKTMVSDFVGA